METLTPYSIFQEFFEVLLRSFKQSGTSFGSSSGGSSSTAPWRGGRDFNSSGALLCRMCNNRHFGECRQQVLGPSGNTPTGYDDAYHYQGDVAPYSGRPYQYPHDPYYQGGYPQYQEGYQPYPPYPGGELQWYSGGQSQNVEVASSSAGSTRQPNQLGQR
ncbi:annexin A7-like [Pyrus ussuriensis x Pyrus communis]|uniref:Annexin A7-like n=1 Tax=Pyrus ussuriensis x Pyrus communis TaxID=2448454 RepID=A0A5N5GGU3_9ROSA|nr:annexin A7-like [Pyrus ussuriensis x Pyrus communis]